MNSITSTTSKKTKLSKYSILSIVIFIFLFSLTLRIWNINQMGRTWDELFYVKQGNLFINLIINKDFKSPDWYSHPDPPPLSKYFYATGERVESLFPCNSKMCNYDLTGPRVVSALFSSLTAILIFFIGFRFFSLFVGFSSSLIFAMLPFFLGFSQLVSIESILMFFFTASVFSFLLFLQTGRKKWLILTSLLFGLSMLTKYTNILLLPVFIWSYAIWNNQKFRTKNTISFKYTFITISVVGLILFFLLWPMPFFHIAELAEYSYSLRIETNKFSVPEVFFGEVIHVPKIYYIIQFVLTTPALLLILFTISLLMVIDLKRKMIKVPVIKSNKISSFNYLKYFKNLFLFSDLSLKKFIYDKKTVWVFLVIVVWFIVPFSQSLYNFRQQGIRYIIEIYAPFSILCGIGIDYFTNRISPNSTIVKYSILLVVVFYLFFTIGKISPYYLDYFNEFSGGTKNVYDKELFQLGWWGQGIREAAIYIEKNSKASSSVGLAVSPIESFPKFNKLNFERYEMGENYDYVLVGYYDRTRLGFDDFHVKKNYNLVYSVDADGAEIIKVYKRKID